MSYQGELEITPQALRTGIYLRPFSKAELVATAMLAALTEHYKKTGAVEKLIAISQLALSRYPKNVDAMLNLGFAHYLLFKKEYLLKYPNPADVPPSKRARAMQLQRTTDQWYERAEALGWRMPREATAQATGRR